MRCRVLESRWIDCAVIEWLRGVLDSEVNDEGQAGRISLSVVSSTGVCGVEGRRQGNTLYAQTEKLSSCS